MVYRLAAHKEELVLQLVRLRFSVREINRRTGVSKYTIGRVMREVGLVSELTKKCRSQTSQSSVHKCDNCKMKFVAERESSRKTSRTKHTFCCMACCGEYRRRQNDGDKCNRCGKQRGKIWGRVMCRKMCQYCYSIMRDFGFDENLARAYELTQKLKKEIGDGKAKRPSGVCG